MRRGIAGLVLFLAAAVSCGGATLPLRWRWSNPRPHGNNIVDMTYSATLALGVQVAERGQLYTSTDLETWVPQESGTANALRGVCYLGERIVVTGERGTVLYANAGETFLAGTLLSGPTEDWLESVAASASLAVAVGDNAAIYTSADGMEWRRRTNGIPTTAWLTGVSYGAGRFVAVGEAGTILSSADGTNWLLRASGTTSDLRRVSYGNGEFTAVGTGGLTRRSPDGLTWVVQTTGATNDLFAVTTGGPDRLVGGVDELRLFDNATLQWSNQIHGMAGAPPWTYYAALGRPGFFLVGGRTGMLVEGYQTSIEPYLWLPASLSPRTWLFEVAWLTNLFVAVGDRATVMTSSSGGDWVLETVPPSLTNAIFLGVGGTTNLLVAAGSQGALMISPLAYTNLVVTNTSGVIITQQVSTLGVVWHAVEPRPSTNDLQGVTWFHGQYVVTGDAGTVLISPDGTNWAVHTAPTTTLLSGVAASPTVLVACGDDGVLLSSPDAVQWTPHNTGTSDWIYRVRHLPGGFVATGQNGTLFTSPDGTEWTSRPSGTSEWLTDVAWLADTWFVVGTGGTVLMSADAVTWTNVGTITLKGLYGVVADARQLVTVGVEGVILRSPVVPDPTPVQFLSYSRSVVTNAAAVQEIFLLAGQPDQRCTLDHRLDLEGSPWIAGPLLEFYDASGTIYYLQTTPLTNAPPGQYYRATLAP